MKKITISSDLTIYDSIDELPEVARGLMERSSEARENSYSPYSQFKVGAALLLDNDQVVIGSNQENASYPAGLCAERTAIFYAGARYPEAKMLMLAISVRSLKYTVDRPTAPCGSCRQAIAEYEVKQEEPIEIYFMGETGKVMKADSISALLPLIFDKSYL